MNIVVGFIRSEEGLAALDRAVAEARLRNARLLVVHARKGGHGEDEAELLAYRDALEEIDRRLDEEGLEHEVKHLIRGNTPTEDLLEVAKEAGAELIVIGIRRRSPVGKMILGSNAQEILLDADCPVLAVKAVED
jgi:nucleotide-binding universal stress UspA family protein